MHAGLALQHSMLANGGIVTPPFFDNLSYIEPDFLFDEWLNSVVEGTVGANGATSSVSTLNGGNGTLIGSNFNISSITNEDGFLIFQHGGLSTLNGYRTQSGVLFPTNAAAAFYGGAAFNSIFAGGPILSWTDAEGGSGGAPTGDNSEGNGAGTCFTINTGSTGVEKGVSFKALLDTTARKYRIFFRDVEFGAQCRAVLEDGSGLSAISNVYSNGDTTGHFEFQAQSTLANQLIRFELFTPINVSAAIVLWGLALYH